MSSILSTQNRHIFLRRKYCFLPITALSPPVGREEPLMGLPPLVSAMITPCPQWIRLPLATLLAQHVPVRPEGPAWPEPQVPRELPATPSAWEPDGGRRACHGLSS